MIFYEKPSMKEEFDTQLHPDVKQVVTELEPILEAYNEMVRLTEVCRSNDDSERIYTEIAGRLLSTNGKGINGVDFTQWHAIKDLSPVGLRNWCRSRPSWHKPWAAVDIGFQGMDPVVVARVCDYLKQRCESPFWELITEPHGTGPHAHLGRRDYAWLKQFPGSLRDAQGRKNPSQGT